ncbi:MAG: tRNA-guanine transglycosylase [Promethearchaeota archaeon]
MKFQIRDVDGWARTGNLSVNGKLLKSPCIFLGHSFNRGNPFPWHYFNVDSLLINAYDLLVQKIDAIRVRQILEFDGVLMMDSGGYQIQRFKKDIDLETIVRIQEMSKPDIAIPLDYPLTPKMNNKEVHSHIKKTFRSNIHWKESYPYDFIPVIHGYNEKHLIDQINKLDTPDFLAIGSFVPILMYSDRKRLVDLLITVRKKYPDCFIHFFGVSYLVAFLLFLLGADSVDTSAHLHNARYGSIHLQHTGPRAIAINTKKRSRPSAHKLIEQERFLNESCGCPICNYLEFDHFKVRGVRGLQLRGIHNAWVYNSAPTELRQIIKEKKTTEFIEKIFLQSGLYYLYKYAKRNHLT